MAHQEPIDCAQHRGCRTSGVVKKKKVTEAWRKIHKRIQNKPPEEAPGFVSFSSIARLATN